MPRIRAEQLKDYTLTNLQIALNAAISQSKIAGQTEDPTGWISKGTIHVVNDPPVWDGSQEGQLYYVNGTDELYIGTGISPFFTTIGGNAGFDSSLTVKTGNQGANWNGTSATRFVADEAFNLDGSNLFVYFNGELMQYSAAGTADYQIINNTTVQLASEYAARADDKVTLLVYTNASLTNYATKAWVEDKLTGSISLTGDTEVGGNLTPSQNNTFDLGSADMHWKDVYVQGGVNFLPIGDGDSLRVYRGLDSGTDTQLKFQIGTSAEDQFIFEDKNQTAIMTIGGDGVVTVLGTLKVTGDVEYMNQSNTETSDATFAIGVAGVRESSEITCPAGTDLGGKYWTLDAPTGAYYVWYDTGSSTDPAPANKTGIKVSINAGDTASQVASKTKDAIAALNTVFIASVNSTVVTVTNIKTGVVTDAANVDAGVTVNVVAQGVNEADGDATFSVARASGDTGLKWNDVNHRWQAIYGTDGATISNILTENDLASGINLDDRYVKDSDVIVAGSSAQGVLKYAGIYDTGTPADGVFYGGIVRPNADTRLNYNGVLYVKDLHTDNNSIYLGTNKISYDTTTNQLVFSDNLATVVLSDTGKISGYRFLKYLGSPKDINGATSTDEAAQEFSFWDYIVLQAGLEAPTHPDYAANAETISNLKRINGNVRIFGSVDIGVSTANYGYSEIELRINHWLDMGATDIALINSGYDKQVSRNRLNTVVGYVHGKNVRAMFDASNPDDVFATAYDATYNPASNTSEADRGDFYLFDKFAIDTAAFSGNAGYADNATFYAKALKITAYAKDTGIVMLANGSIGAGFTELQKNDYWDVFEAMAQAVSVAGYGIAYGDATSNEIHKFAYDTEYVDFYSPRSSFHSSGTSNEIYTRSKSGRSVVACLSGTGSYGRLGYKNVKKYDFKKSDAFYSATAVPSSVAGNIKFDGLFTATRLLTASDVKFLSGVNTGTIAQGGITGDRTWTLRDQTGTVALEQIAGSTDKGAVAYNGTTSLAGTFNGGATKGTDVATQLNFNGVLTGSRLESSNGARVFGGTAYYHELAGSPTANRNLTLPDYNGMVAILRTASDTAEGTVKFTGTSTSEGTFNGGTTAPTGTQRLNYEGYFYATRVYNAVWNDIVDFVEAPAELAVEYGKVYIRNKAYVVEKSSQYMQKGILGIASDTFGIAAGKVEEINQIPIAIGGYVLAYTRGVYEPGTVLTSDSEGYLIEMSEKDKVAFPERMVATFDRPEAKEVWNGIVVNGRNWVKVK